MVSALTPRFDIQGLKRLRFSYDAEFDLANIHIEAPQPASTIEVDDGWYLRLSDEAIVGMELHGLKRIFLSSTLFARVFTPSLDELRQHTGKTIDEDFTADGSAQELPHTSHLLLFMLGAAAMKLQARQLAETTDARAAMQLANLRSPEDRPHR
ncbi:MAG: hypothetical protein DK306_002133 [Chloroflexi bacterium]|jgi:hypothetical protein|nr:MAG: hypothetical protein DK306_002133 [Chloroflexota bacterium]